MPDQKISALTGLTDIADNDLIPMVDITANETKKVQADTLYEYVQKNKNLVINGNFDRWERATSQTSSGYGSDDRFTNTNVGSTKTHSQQSFTIGQTDVPNNPKYYSRTVVSSVAAAGNYCVKFQNIEDVTKLSGKTVTLSFYAKADSAKNIATEFTQDFGTGGSPSAPVLSIGVKTHALTTSWQKFTATATITSVSGKTLGTDGNDTFAFAFWFEAGSGLDARTNSLGHQSGTFDIAQVQLEEGSLATQFEHRPIAEEIALCQRYFISYGGDDVYEHFASGMAQTTNEVRYVLHLPVEMRDAPTLSTTGAFRSFGATAVTGISFATFLYAGKKQVVLRGDTTGHTAGDGYILTANNDLTARLQFDAEL